MAFQQYDVYPCLTPVRTVSASNVSGTYYNGPLNNGVGATLTIAASSLTVDSVVMAVGDRLLLSAQTNANENGIYVVLSIGATVVLQRAADFQCIEQMKAGQFVTVGAGTNFNGDSFGVVEPLPAILGVSNLVLAQPAVSASAPFVVLGNITAGASGTAGKLGSFPSAATSGELFLAAVTNSAGNFNTTISNAASVGQSQVISVPDSGATTANFILSKSAGTQHITSGNLQVDAGSLISGLSTGGQVGTLQLFATTTTTGSIRWLAAANGGNFNVDFTNASFGQSTVFTWADPASATAKPLISGAAVVSGNLPKYSGTAGLTVDSGIAAANVQTSALSSPDTISDLVWKDVALTAAALATSGHVQIQASSGSKQYKVRNILVNYSAAGLSGGGGDRLVQVTDGTTVYNNAGITAALLGTPVNTVWGGSGNPLPGTVAMNTSTAAGADLYAVYSGGAADYTTGTVNISVLVQRVA